MAYPIMAPSNTWYKTSVLRSTITEINIVDNYASTNISIFEVETDYALGDQCYLFEPLALDVGSQYTVNLNGTIYNCTYADDGNEYYYLGNLSIVNSEKPNTDEPFVYFYNKGMDDEPGYCFDAPGHYIWSIYQENETETWNADVDNSGSIKCYLNGTVLTIAGNGSGKIALNEDSSYLFSSTESSNTNKFTNLTTINGANIFDASNARDFGRLLQYCTSLLLIDVSLWDTQNVTNMRNAFSHCRALTSLDISKWKTGNVTSMRRMFQNACTLQSLDLSDWDVGNVVDMNGMFIGTVDNGVSTLMSLTTIGDVSNWDVSKVTDMTSMFYNCASLSTIPVSNWRTSACTNMQTMFVKCTALTELDVSNWDVSKVTNFNSMFSMNDYGANPPPITTLDVSNWDVSSATDMGWMFYGLANLKTLDVSKWDVSKVESFHHCFAWCTSLVITGLENWDVSSAKTLNAMFHNVRNTTYDVSKWDVSNVESFGQMFEQNPYVTNIYGLENWNTSTGKAFYSMFSGCPKLKELDLSSFDTRNANENWIDPQRNAPGGGMYDMFGRSSDSEYQYYVNHDMKKITFGKNFSFNGDGTCTAAILPAPLITYIDDADGNWYDSCGVAHSINDIPNLTAGTYYASKAVIDEPVLVEYGTMYKIANQIRKILETSELYTPSNMVAGLQELWYQIKNLFDITKLTGEAIGTNGEDYSRFLDIQDDVITITTSMYSMGAILMKGQTLERGTYNISFEARNNKTSEEFSNNKIYVTLSDGNGSKKEVVKHDLSVYKEWATMQCNMTIDFDNAMLSLVPEGGKDYTNPNFSFRNIRVAKQ